MILIIALTSFFAGALFGAAALFNWIDKNWAVRFIEDKDIWLDGKAHFIRVRKLKNDGGKVTADGIYQIYLN